jgi:3-hydroxyisobutyrate dehydrogenase-like beta-hydroxyacid dehydrogenase
MGSRIAGRLLDAGHPVSATNRTAGKAQPLIERGLAWLGTAREVAASADVVPSMVTTRRSKRSRPARGACSPASERDRSTWT